MDSPNDSSAKAQNTGVTAVPPASSNLPSFNLTARITGAIAHDFNNILTGMMGNLELMQRRANRLGITDFNDYLAGAQSAASRGAKFTQALLAIAGHQPLEPTTINLPDFLQTMKEPLAAKLPSSGRLTIICPPGMPDIFCDETALINLCLELAHNAGMSPGTKNLIIAAEPEPQNALPYGLKAEKYISLSVTDDGAGMTDEIAARAFEPFFSTRNSAGLGLSKILGFARQSGGHVFIASHQTGNTRITLILPAATHRD